MDTQFSSESLQSQDSTGSCYSDQCFDTIDSIAQAMVTLDSEIFESDFQPANLQTGHDFGDQR